MGAPGVSGRAASSAPEGLPRGPGGGLGLGQGVTFHEPTDLLGEGDGLHLAGRWGGRSVRRERGVKAWCQGRRASRQLSPGGGTCTSVAAAAAAAARPGRRAGPRARGALRKWRARRAGGAPRAGDTCARVHAPLPLRAQVEGLGGEQRRIGKAPTRTKD